MSEAKLMTMESQPKKGTVYVRKTDGARLRYEGDPGNPEFYEGWVSAGPRVFDKLVGPAWGWPYVYQVDPDQSWPETP